MREAAEFVVNNATGAGNATAGGVLQMCANNIGACLAIVTPTTALLAAGIAVAATCCFFKRAKKVDPEHQALVDSDHLGDKKPSGGCCPRRSRSSAV
ncbi:MAG TPA: hypothetical protein VGV92_06930 [Gammaproteobacteria bacterium]|nr:hypothetical protein [Gammaproteobacteria bacterium]